MTVGRGLTGGMHPPLHLPHLHGHGHDDVVTAAVAVAAAVALGVGAVRVVDVIPLGHTSTEQVGSAPVAAPIDTSVPATTVAGTPDASDPIGAAVAQPAQLVTLAVPTGMELGRVTLWDTAGREVPPTSAAPDLTRFDGLAAGSYVVVYQVVADAPIVADGVGISATQAVRTAPLAVGAGGSILVAVGGGAAGASREAGGPGTT